jgi:hypothetical protein
VRARGGTDREEFTVALEEEGVAPQL